MTIPATVSGGLDAFSAAVDAAGVLETAPALQVAALVSQGRGLLSTVDGALKGPGALLDAPDPAGYPQQILAAFLSVADAADTQVTLVDMRGLLGRAVLNLSQAGG